METTIPSRGRSRPGHIGMSGQQPPQTLTEGRAEIAIGLAGRFVRAVVADEHLQCWITLAGNGVETFAEKLRSIPGGNDDRHDGK